MSHRIDRERGERGAVTLIGLGAGCFLVGSTWWTIGIGRAVMLHDKLQEAADAMASAGSTVHARGMNLIGTINLVMLALVAVFIIMAIISDIVNVGVLAVIACAATPFGAPVCGPAVAPAKAAHATTVSIREGYMRVMQPTISAMSHVQTGVAIVMPISAQIASIRSAFRYDQVGISFSPALIPGGTPTMGVDITGPSLSVPSFKLGLPVSHEKMGKLCEMAGAYSANWLRRSIGKIPAAGRIMDLPGIRAVISMAITKFSQGVRYRYCVGGFWETPGPKQVWNGARNGNDWMQNWSFVLNTGKNDPNEKMVSVGTFRYTVGGGAVVSLPDFFAQAEMFFDCDGTWDSPTCNGPGGKKAYDYTIYGLKWVERIRRFGPPSFGELLGGFVGDFLSSQLQDVIGGSIKDLGPFQDLQKWAGGFGGEYGAAAADDAFGFLAGKADAKIDSVRSGLIGLIPGGGNGPTSIILH